MIRKSRCHQAMWHHTACDAYCLNNLQLCICHKHITSATSATYASKKQSLMQSVLELTNETVKKMRTNGCLGLPGFHWFLGYLENQTKYIALK
jgi:hypothetical protein